METHLMAAAVTTTATTLEAQLVEVAQSIQDAEAAATAADANFESLLTIAADPEEGSITITVTLPATVAGSGGNLTFTPTEYLP
jgi:hydroxymethylglutaryl-CoA reductase